MGLPRCPDAVVQHADEKEGATGGCGQKGVGTYLDGEDPQALKAVELSLPVVLEEHPRKEAEPTDNENAYDAR